MKPQEQRIKDAAEHLRINELVPPGCSPSAMARAILEAADREPPKWPADETVRQYRLALGMSQSGPGRHAFECSRDAVRVAFLTDPIITTAVAYGQLYRRERQNVGAAAQALIDAVAEAGL